MDDATCLRLTALDRAIDSTRGMPTDTNDVLARAVAYLAYLAFLSPTTDGTVVIKAVEHPPFSAKKIAQLQAEGLVPIIKDGKATWAS